MLRPHDARRDRLTAVALSLTIAGVVPATVALSTALPKDRSLDFLMVPLQAFFVGLFIYHLVLVALGVRRPDRTVAPTPRSRFAILVAAHDEELVVAQLIRSLHAQDYPRELFDVFVVADHCTDGTAAAAHAAGARVFEREGPGRRGKGPAIEWLMQQVLALDEPSDAVVIFDADNLAAPTFLRRMDAYLQRGDQVIQGYLGVKNPDDSWITRAIYISYAYTNRFFQLAKQSTGLGSALGGTGLCIAVPLLRRLGWRCDALTEDLEFQIRAILAGVRPTWGWEAVVYDEKPLTFRAAWRQRRRWMQGHANVAVRYLPALFRQALGRWDLVAWDAVIYLAAPIWLSGATLLTGAYLANQLAPRPFYTHLFPAWLPPLLLVMSCIYPYVALWLEGSPVRRYLQPTTLLATILLAVCWPLLGFLGLLQHRNRHWVKTEHTRSLSVEEAHHQTQVQQAAVHASGDSARLVPARVAAVGMIAAVVVATLTPHLTARRLRPPLEEGATLLLEGQVTRAVTRFKEAIAEQPEDPVGHAFLALAHRLNGQTLAAAGAYLRVKQLDPNLGDTTVAVVDFFLRHRDHSNNERLLQEALRSARSGPEAYAWVANLFIDRRRLGDAQLIASDGLRRFGPTVSLLKVQGYLHLARGQASQAVDVLRQAQRKAPHDADVLINLGWAYYRLRRVDLAVAAWERALELNPANEALRRDLDRVRRLL